MQLPKSNSTEAGSGIGFADVLPQGVVLGIMTSSEGTTGSDSKEPGTAKLVLGLDIIEGPLAYHFKKWTERDKKGNSHYLQLHLPINDMPKLKFVLAHFGAQTGGKAERFITSSLANENIPIEQLPLAELKSGAILKWNKKGFIDIGELVSLDEGRKTGLTGEPRPARVDGKSSGGGSTQPQSFDTSFNPAEFGGGGGAESFTEQVPGFSGGEAPADNGGGFGGGFE